ncbi:uncharacterized protein LOC128992248 isoform X2 [Macrosteles quadrilineatus]|nr:uncharacterized protein LOC128992248 isoform X2 [Macrosteles quadrilineatus]
MTCVDLESLMNQLDPEILMKEHLSSLKQALFHSHTKVVQVAVKQFIRVANDKRFTEQLSEDLEAVLGMIENLAHKEQRVARDCVTVLLLLTSTHRSLMNLLCPDITDVIKTIMTYVAVRLLVYEFILQLSINSPIGLEKSHSCGILEDVINDFKKKESYLTPTHHLQLHSLAATAHGRAHLGKYEALDCVAKTPANVPREAMSHLITVVPVDTSPQPSGDLDKAPAGEMNKPTPKPFHPLRAVRKNHHHLPSNQPVLAPVMTPLYLDHIPRESSETRDVHLTSSSSSLSSPCDSLDSSTLGRKHDRERSFTPPLHSPRGESVEDSASELSRLVSTMRSVPPHELLTRRGCLDTVVRGLRCPDKHNVLLALQVIGYLGSTIDGKRLLYKQSKKEKFMSLVMRKLLDSVVHSSTDNRLRALHVFYNLMNMSETNMKYEKITRKWFRLMGRPQEVMKLIVTLCHQPPQTTQVPAYRLLRALAHQEWGQHYIRGRKGMLDMLLTVHHEESEVIRDAKNSVLEALLSSQTASRMFKGQTLDRIHSFLYRFKESSK